MITDLNIPKGKVNSSTEDNLLENLASSLSAWDNNNKNLKILAIDDEPTDLEILKRHLSKISEWEIDLHTFEDPISAWEEVDSQEFDVALLDYNIGSESGLEALENIRSVREDLPIIMVTGCGSEQVAVKAMQAGASDYVIKENLSSACLRRSISNALQKATLVKSVRCYREHLERTVETLTNKNSQILAFYHTVAHELKTPLSSVREFINLVLDGSAGPITSDQSMYLKLAEESTSQVKQIIHDLLDSARLETGKFSIHKSEESLSNLIVQSLSSIALTAKLKKIELIQDFPSDLPKVDIDKARIQQVLMNLLTNALKFTSEEGSITVSAKIDPSSPNFIVIEVSDTGIGLTQEQINSVFNPFFQAEDGDVNATDTGLGIGLSISQDLVKLHGGEIWVVSDPGEGSCFSFTIPIKER